MSAPRQTTARHRGLSLPETVITISLISVVTSLSAPSLYETYMRQKVDSASRRISPGLERALAAAEEDGDCSLSLSSAGWTAAGGSSLPLCVSRDTGVLATGLGIASDVQLRHTFPAALTFYGSKSQADRSASAAGMAVLSAQGTRLQRCVVLAPTLGLVRLGSYEGNVNTSLSEASCTADRTL